MAKCPFWFLKLTEDFKKKQEKGCGLSKKREKDLPEMPWTRPQVRDKE